MQDFKISEICFDFTHSSHLIWNLHDNYFIHKVTMALKTTNYEVHVDCI